MQQPKTNKQNLKRQSQKSKQTLTGSMNINVRQALESWDDATQSNKTTSGVRREWNEGSVMLDKMQKDKHQNRS